MPLTPSHPLLALDYGTARIGLAATDDLGIGVHPVATLDARDEAHALDAIVQEAQKRRSTTLIIGLPLCREGREGEAAARVRKFAQKLATALPALPQIFHDESFSTVQASQRLREAGKPARRQKNIIDQAAAMEILRDYLRW